MVPQSKDKILTFTGLYVDPLDLQPDDICIEDIAHALSLMCRFNGHSKFHYSVAQHSLIVLGLAPEHALYALLHDATEAYLTDMTKPVKRRMPGYSVAEDRAAIVIANKFGLSLDEPAEVKQADLVALATERRDLMRHGNVEWQYLEGIEPTFAPIFKMEPEDVEEAFLAAFKTITTCACCGDYKTNSAELCGDCIISEAVRLDLGGDFDEPVEDEEEGE